MHKPRICCHIILQPLDGAARLCSLGADPVRCTNRQTDRRTHRQTGILYRQPELHVHSAYFGNFSIFLCVCMSVIMSSVKWTGSDPAFAFWHTHSQTHTGFGGTVGWRLRLKSLTKLQIQHTVKFSHYKPFVSLAIKIQPPPHFLPFPQVVTYRKKIGECEQIIDRDNQADRHKAGQGGGGERQSVFEIRCILMSSSCSINDDLCRLQIEYSPVSERKTEMLLTPRLSNLHLWFPHFFSSYMWKNKKKPLQFLFVLLLLLHLSLLMFSPVIIC